MCEVSSCTWTKDTGNNLETRKIEEDYSEESKELMLVVDTSPVSCACVINEFLTSILVVDNSIKHLITTIRTFQ